MQTLINTFLKNVCFRHLEFRICYLIVMALKSKKNGILSSLRFWEKESIILKTYKQLLFYIKAGFLYEVHHYYPYHLIDCEVFTWQESK